MAEVVGDEQLFGEWKEEMEMMSGRIKVSRGLGFAWPDAGPTAGGFSASGPHAPLVHMRTDLHAGTHDERPAPRPQTVRKDLFDHLTLLEPSRDWSFVTSQASAPGMFRPGASGASHLRLCLCRQLEQHGFVRTILGLGGSCTNLPSNSSCNPGPHRCRLACFPSPA